MFSVVIPVFNHERYLAQCVVSAAASPLVSEVLLLDDGSRDGSYDLVRALSRGALGKVRDVTPAPRTNHGAHAALNALIAQAKCEWVAVLNSDDVFIPNRFASIQRKLQRTPCDLIFGDLSVLDGAGKQLGRKRGPFDPQLPFPHAFDVAAMAAAGDWLDLLSHQNFVATTSNIIFQKSLFERIGGFADYRYVHDWDFMLRASVLGQVGYLPQPLTGYRIHGANTIKESSSKVDEEVRAMFARVRADFPALAERPLFQIGLIGNPYLSEQPAAPLLTIDDSFYAQTVTPFVALGANGTYVYAPPDPLDALTPGELQNAVLALSFQDLDSWGPVTRAAPGARAVPVSNMLRNPQTSQKPVVFILPAMFAVGGVERLAIDMMRQLRAQYDFVVITTERLSPEQGSLQGQTEGLALGFYNLAEIAPADLFLPMMRELQNVYRPALVWICNGAPWQCDHAAGIRAVFTNIPIVDQEAYDTEAGWIARFGDPGIQSYDRFIAINTKIQDTFIRKYRIAPGKIDMIYHSVNLEAVGPLARTEEERRAYREKYGLPADVPVFGWIGRLTQQKRPLEFLEFTRRAADGRHFVMIGNGELADACDRFLAEHGIRHVTAVRFSNRMAELFAVMSGLLGTSEYEGLPISMLEALSMGVPVFSTDVGDVGVVMSEYNAGRVTGAAWDIERYLAEFQAWAVDLPEWQARAQEAAPRVRARFAGAEVARDYDACWRRAMADMASSTTNQDMTPSF